jgi:hypothetical protein
MTDADVPIGFRTALAPDEEEKRADVTAEPRTTTTTRTPRSS